MGRTYNHEKKYRCGILVIHAGFSRRRSFIPEKIQNRLTTLCALIFVVYQIVKVILDAINEYAVGNISGDTGELAISVSKQLDSGPFDPIGLAMMILIFCWVAAMVDIVRIGISKKTPEPK